MLDEQELFNTIWLVNTWLGICNCQTLECEDCYWMQFYLNHIRYNKTTREDNDNGKNVAHVTLSSP